jgi:hypothetical protein
MDLGRKLLGKNQVREIEWKGGLKQNREIVRRRSNAMQNGGRVIHRSRKGVTAWGQCGVSVRLLYKYHKACHDFIIAVCVFVQVMSGVDALVHEVCVP